MLSGSLYLSYAGSFCPAQLEVLLNMPKMSELLTEMWNKIALVELQGKYDELKTEYIKLAEKNKKLKKKLKKGKS